MKENLVFNDRDSWQTMIDEHFFYLSVGRPPVDDELNRVNCTEVGILGHYQCGWCGIHNKPRFICGCMVRAKEVTKGIAMNKPVGKKKYVILAVQDERERRIIFYADRETAEGFFEFGSVECVGGDKYSMRIFGGYDFDEVVAYMVTVTME